MRNNTSVGDRVTAVSYQSPSLGLCERLQATAGVSANGQNFEHTLCQFSYNKY